MILDTVVAAIGVKWVETIEGNPVAERYGRREHQQSATG